MDSEREIDNYEFTLSPIGALLSFDPPAETHAGAARPRGFPGQPSAHWDAGDAGPSSRPGSRARLTLIYPNLPRPARLVFHNPPEPMRRHLEARLPFIVCQTRSGHPSRAHHCLLEPAPESESAPLHPRPASALNPAS